MSDDDEKSEASSISSEGSSLPDDLIDDMIASPLSLVKAGGPTMINLKKTLDLRQQPRKGLQYYPFDLSGELDKTLPFTGTTFDMNTGIATSILIINSRDRDRNVYPQPTFFTLRVPRIYRNIVSFQILQLKLLSSFFYFRPDKENVAIQILEYGRTIVNEKGATVDNKITNFIRTGSYDITSLLTEVQTQLNRTPLFFDFPNGISDFVPLFTSTGDLAIGFNQPGDNFYDALRRKFVPNPTVATITSYYFPSQYAGLSTYNLQQVKYAYYFPVLYECYLDPEYGPSTLNLNLTTSALLPGETIDQRILYTSQGLNDPVIAELINNNLVYLYKQTNINILDYYRVRHTFRYSLVNQYLCTYETFNNRINISSSNLNTSLVNLINLQAAKFLAAELQRLGLTQAQYNSLVSAVNVNTAVFTNMYNFLQSNMATYFGVNFNTYAPVFFADASNSLFIQNGINATGVDTGYSLAVLSRNNQLITSSSSNLQDTPVYWPNMKNMSGGTINTPYNLSDASSIPYNAATRSFLPNNFVDISGFVYTDITQKSGDIIIPVEPAKYTVFRFRSPVRQNLQVETMPLPYYYRYVEYNKTQGGNQAAFFDISYAFLYNSKNQLMDNTSSITTLTTSYNESFNSAFAAATSTQVNIQNSYYYYKLITPLPNDITLDASGYKYSLNITVMNANSSAAFGTPISLFLYHDRGAFMADVSGLRNENPYHYTYSATATADLSSASIDFRAYARQTYYMIFRTNSQSFPTFNMKVFPWYSTPRSEKILFTLNGFNPFASPYTDLSNQIFANVNDTDFVRLPSTSNLWGLDPSSSVFNKTLPISEPAIGYDVSGTLSYGGVSTDLTDYKGYLQVTDLSNVPFSQYRKDPINNYTFNKLSPYSSNSQTYFYGGSSNTLLKPYTNSNYTAGTVVTRQFKLVHWYDYNYIPAQKLEPTPAPADVATMTPFTDTLVTVPGYEYSATNIQIGNNLCGFTFLPSDGVWSAQSMFFKSAWNNPITDCSNDDIQYIGIYNTSQLTNIVSSNIQLSNAIQVLEFDRKVNYTPAEITTNSGFDARGGTYYKFVLNSNFPVANSNLQISGYSPGSNTLLPATALYSMIAFNADSNVTSMYLLAGSTVPYPEISDPSGATAYFGSPAPTGQGVVVPRLKIGYNQLYYPPNGNIYTSQYEQSAAIGTQALHYTKDGNITTDASGLYPFNFAALTDNSGSPTVFSQFNIRYVAATSTRVYGVAAPLSAGSNNHSAVVLYNTNTGANRNIAETYSRETGYGDITSNFTTYRPTSLYCTAGRFPWDEYTYTSNFTIYKDDTDDFFLSGNTCVNFNLNPLFPEPASSYSPINYVINNANKWGAVLNGNFNLVGSGNSNLMYFSYSAGGSSIGNDIQNAQCKGSNGFYYAPTSCNTGRLLGDQGASLTMDVASNTVYFLPYDQFVQQYSGDSEAVQSGSNLYQFDITQPPNPESSLIGFTKGTIVYQFTGSPGTFSYANYYKDGIVLLRTLSNDAIYYISSSNLVSSNENYSFYTCTTSVIAQSLSLPNGNLGNLFTGPGGVLFAGAVSAKFVGEDDVPPRYIAYTSSDPSGSTGYFETYDQFGSISQAGINFYYVIPTLNGSYTIYKNPSGLAVTATITSGPPYVTSYYTYPGLNLVTGYSVYQYINDLNPYLPTYSSFKLYGNRANIYDVISTKVLNTAWQIFYPNYKINLTKLANSASPITNTTDLTTYPYYPHTSMFYYNSFNKMVTDISGRWAHEKKTNFIASDVSSGYFFFSYINTINLKRSSNYTNTDNSSYNYLAIRGYSPSERFKCLLRFYLPGRYDFGYISLFDIMQEAQQTVLVDLSGSALVNPTYANALNLFNNSFKITSNFGNNSVPGFGGSNLTFTGFSNFMVQYNSIYTSGLSNANLLNSITSNVVTSLRGWISTYLGNILPSYVLPRDNFTAALTFSILWRSELTPARRAMDDDWGLGYNLGFLKIDTPYSTVQRATSFFKILEDFIYLRLNQEFVMNRMDTCSREDLSVTHEPTGATNQYAAKLLLSQFGNYATVLVQNPINFNPVLASLDRLSFQWVDASVTTIDNDECEWNAVVQIQEQVTAPRVGSTIPQPPKQK